MKEVGGVVMVNFYSCFLRDDCNEHNATVADVVKHINHIRWKHIFIPLQFGFAKQYLLMHMEHSGTLRKPLLGTQRKYLER